MTSSFDANASSRSPIASARSTSSTRPTFFELVAADKLSDALRDAFAYALGTLANVNASRVANVALDYGDEIFALLSFVAETKALSSGDGGVAESVYGLQRAPRALKPERLSSDGRYRIDREQRFWSAVILAFAPYVARKCAVMHERLAPERYAGSRRGRTSAFDGGDVSARERDERELNDIVRRREAMPGIRGFATRAFVKVYPAANAAMETATLVAWAGYLFGRWNINDPALILVDCYITRALPSELEANAREVEAWRAIEMRRAREANSPAARIANVGALRVKNFVMDYAQSALIAAVVGFKLTEWWYGAAEERVANATTLPVPPPPPRPPPHPLGVALPEDKNLCPLCRKTIRNPALLVCSGYVFCYSCVHAHVDRYSDCPVSLHRAVRGVDDIRRLFDGSS